MDLLTSDVTIDCCSSSRNSHTISSQTDRSTDGKIINKFPGWELKFIDFALDWWLDVIKWIVLYGIAETKTSTSKNKR